MIGNARRLAKAGRLDMIPSNYSAFCADFTSRRYRADVAQVQLAEAGDGRLSASLSNDYVIDAARGARLVIAEINPDAPWTFGAEWPVDAPIHMRVAERRPPVELASTPLDGVAQRIAAHAASLIGDGSTLQFGRRPHSGCDPVLALPMCAHLGIHSGLTNDAVVDPIERRAVTNAEKCIDAGITNTNQSDRHKSWLYRFVHQEQIDCGATDVLLTHG